MVMFLMTLTLVPSAIEVPEMTPLPVSDEWATWEGVLCRLTQRMLDLQANIV